MEPSDELGRIGRLIAGLPPGWRAILRALRQKSAWEYRTTGHDVRDGVAIVFIVGAVGGEELIQSRDVVEMSAGRLQANGYTVIRERELDMRLCRLAAEIARRIDPHAVERGQRPLPHRHSPRFVRKEMCKPQKHAEPEVLCNMQSRVSTLHKLLHLDDLVR